MLFSSLIAFGCDSSLNIKAPGNSKPLVTDVGSVEVEENDQVTVKGLNFSPKLTLEINGAVTALNVISGTEATFQIPSFGDSDILYAVFKENSTTVGTFPFVKKSEGGKFSSTVLPENVCTDVLLTKDDGTLVRGSRDCTEQVSACSQDGELNCKTSADFVAASTAGLAEKIVTGAMVGGIAGSADAKPDDCTSDGETDCIAVNGFPAIKVSDLDPNTIESGISIAGVAGALVPAASACTGNGQTGCVTTSTYQSADLTNLMGTNVKSGVTIAGTLGSFGAACSADGGTNCLVDGASYKAAKLSNFSAADVKTGVTVAGIAGSATLESHSNCVSDGADSCVVDGTSYKAAKLSNFVAADVKSTVTIAGVAGSATLESHSDCTGNAQTGCITTSTYKSGDITNLSAGNVKSGVAIAGVTGQYPSTTYPLSGADSTDDLDAATFNAKIKSSTSFEWFDSAGNRYTGTGHPDLTAANIKDGISIFGTTGTFAPNCTSDGQTDCLSTTTFKAANTGSFTAWDIRSGKTVAGIAGLFKLNKDMITTSIFDRTGGGYGVTAGADYYDNIDDWGNGVAIPSTNAPGFPALSLANWVRESTTDTGAGGGTASDGICNGSEKCIYQDKITGLLWLRTEPGTYDWEGAIGRCFTNAAGGFTTGWRLPSQKELMQAYIDGIRSLSGSSKLNFPVSNKFYSSTTGSVTTTMAWVHNLGGGDAFPDDKATSYNVMCVHD